MSNPSNPSDRAAICELLLARRIWERERFPLFKPQIALDIILYSTLQSERGSPACAKDFHIAIGSSPDRVRQVLNQLEHDGWIRSFADRQDARLRRIVPTARALEMVEEYGKLFGPLPPTSRN